MKPCQVVEFQIRCEAETLHPKLQKTENIQQIDGFDIVGLFSVAALITLTWRSLVHVKYRRCDSCDGRQKRRRNWASCYDVNNDRVKYIKYFNWGVLRREVSVWLTWPENILSALMHVWEGYVSFIQASIYKYSLIVTWVGCSTTACCYKIKSQLPSFESSLYQLF